ncbi:enoyl-CoA hydratase/isomerase family protein [Nocardioides sp. zg-536]|uniref:Enoyl-CoA hydratase/isomerase family protein n=1 Tax=Nocardioides faecalis TaxID=2803858 RepID=A0A938YBY8_9ACTN|nr:enoyl-CoA hydratase/isomerase family protein [Nocardioides faecalis]MBM9461196.1 enoyl-CoA hydratase/isomerase family protein [Nocardioides faecalis]MBS4752151.1 enoyl-CoA hydratase/isomerase family protein [Nocardioides faecalis]QVI59044.1 enoyl-CoA hydratase/isomerase family protein [Nocardioides faecalis]
MKKTEAEMLENQWDVENMEVDPEVLARYVRYEVDEKLATATITFDRPELLNAIPVAAFERVGDLVREAETDDRVKVIIFKGEGKHFGTGADAAELGHYIGYKKGTDKASRRRPAQRQRILPDRNVLTAGFTRPIIESLKATICQVQGYCYGGHFQIALSADIVIASPDAKFTHPAFRYLGPAPQDMYHWIEKVGLTTMKDVMLTMRAIGAEEGEAKGLVTKVVPRDELDQWVADYAEAIAVMPLDSLMMGKSMMQIVMEARGKGLGAMTGWVGHGWATNVSFEDGDFNFLKERMTQGVSKALEKRDMMVAPYFRLSDARSQEA